MMKRFFLLFAIAIISIWILSGCSPNETNPLKPENQKEISLSKENDNGRLVLTFDEAHKRLPLGNHELMEKPDRVAIMDKGEDPEVETHQVNGQQYWIARAWIQQVSCPEYCLLIGAANESTPAPCYYMWLSIDADWRWFGLGGNWQYLDEAEADCYWHYWMEISGGFSKPSSWEARNHAQHFFYDPYTYYPKAYDWYYDHTIRGVAHSIIEKNPS